MTAKPPYHHGDLRNALLQAGLAMLEQRGLHGLTLRGIAVRAGVSHAAPAHHFGSLKGLLTALVTLAYSRFEAAMGRERAASGKDPATQMRAAGRGYIGFARAHPALFRLMFSAAEIDWTDAALQASATAARRHLTEIARPAAKPGVFEAAEIEMLVWAAVHGFAVLCIDGHADAPGCQHAAQMPDIARLLFGAIPTRGEG